jgi:hypothetical protein
MLRISSRFGALAAIGAAMLLWSAAPAAAQTQSAAGSMGGGASGIGIGYGGTQVDEATVERRREIESAYKNAIRANPPQQAANNDPWANMRGSNEQKPAAKAGKTAQKKKPAQ